jgi:UDP-N-acetylmuramate dehydrogenase
MLFREHVPLAPYTTFRIGGPARWFAEAATEADLLEAVEFARGRSLPLFVLGGGSNLLVSDAGFAGLVLRIALRRIVASGDGVFSVAAGEDWDGFVSHAVGRDYGGVECLAGIPGTVGGTPVQNVGAYGQEVASTIQSVRALDMTTGEFVELGCGECGFEYRKSIFNSSQRGRYIVSEVVYKLVSDAEPAISYKDLKQYFKNVAAPGLVQVSRAVREIRRRKGMLIVPGDPDCLSAGSFFKNPVVAAGDLERVRLAAGVPEVPHYAAGEGLVKIPAAWLVEQAGFHKGYELGRAGISSRHTLALINRGYASAADVTALRDKIVAAVAGRFGIVLEPEPVWVA